jgi:farnesyl-diphosphate farnesyltransferase
MHWDEVIAGITLALFHRPLPLSSSNYVKEHFDLKLVEFVDQMVMANDVVHVSSLLLRMLPGPVLVDAQVLSQTLRALDCIEDEPVFYGDDVEKKIQDMLTFHEKALVDPDWFLEGVGESPPERQLMREFPKIHRLYKSLREESQKAVWDVTIIMANGMADFLRMDLSQGPKTIEEYTKYCYAISGSVGEGLSRMWSASGLEDASLATNTFLSQQMGNFAIKPTMIFTFMEDFVDKRVKWPQEIWKQYCPTGDIQYFFNQEDPEVQVKSIQCLNAIVTDAFEMIPDALKYLEQLKCLENFQWVATIIVATTAQLDMCYANPLIFKGCVFIRPGIIAKLILKTNTLEQVQESVYNLAQNVLQKALSLDSKVKENDPGYAKTVKVCEEIIKITASGAAAERESRKIRSFITIGLLFLAGMSWFGTGVKDLLGAIGYSQDKMTTVVDPKVIATTLLVVAASMFHISSSSRAATVQPLKKCGRA